jgi:hypothetical protein
MGQVGTLGNCLQATLTEIWSRPGANDNPSVKPTGSSPASSHCVLRFAVKGCASHVKGEVTLIRAVLNSARALALAVVLVCVATGCVASPPQSSGMSYLTSLETAHRLDSRAKALCVKDAGTPISSSTPRLDVAVAANSSLASLREIEPSSVAVRLHDPNLTGKARGYAAICLIKSAQNGTPTSYWTYALPSGDSGPLKSE